MEKDKIKKIEQPTKKPKIGKWSIVGKFIKDVGHFIFDEDKGGDEVKKDLAVLEGVRSAEKEEEKLSRQAAEIEAKKKAEELKKQTELISKKRFWQVKSKFAERFRRERQALLKKQQAEVLKKKQAVESRLLKQQPLNQLVSRHRGFSFFKKKTADQLALVKSVAPNLLANINQQAVEAAPTLLNRSAESDLPGESDKEKAARKFQADRLKHEHSHERSRIENRQWQSFNIVATNLIKEQRSMFFNWQNKILLLVLFVSLSVMACILSYGVLLILEKNKLNANDYIFKNLDGIIAEIKKEEVTAQDILQFNEKLMAVDYLLKNHIYWTNFFAFLENNTITDVYYESFAGDLSGKYNIPSVAKDFRSISLQLKVLQAAADKVVSVDSSGAEAAEAVGALSVDGEQSVQAGARVKFNLNLNLNRSLFIKTPEYE